MGRMLRHMQNNPAIFEITTKTIQSRFLLKPSKKLNELIIGTVAKAIERYDVKLFMFVVLSNHMHMLIQPTNTNTMARFMSFVNANIAKDAGRLHNFRQKIWGRRYASIEILDDFKLQERIKYLLAHGAKEDLVKKPSDWPGVNCVNALTKGKKLKGIWINRSQVHRHGKLKKIDDKDFDIEKYTTHHEIELSTLPILEDYSKQEQQQFYKEIVSDIQKEINARRKLEHKRYLGVKRVKKQHPHHSNSNPKKAPIPKCHASSYERRQEYYEGYKEFVNQFREALDMLYRGHPDALTMFPQNCCIPAIANRKWIESSPPL